MSFLGGLFNRFRSKHDPLLDLSDEEFLYAIHDRVTTMQPGNWTQIAVGFHISALFIDDLQKKIDAKKSTSAKERKLADLGYWMAEIRQRNSGFETLETLRGYYIYLGTAVARAGEISPNDEQSQELLVEIWECLFKGAYIGPGVLKKNVLWSDSEKELFATEQDARFAPGMLQWWTLFPSSIRFDERIERIVAEARAGTLSIGPPPGL